MICLDLNLQKWCKSGHEAVLLLKSSGVAMKTGENEKVLCFSACFSVSLLKTSDGAVDEDEFSGWVSGRSSLSLVLLQRW